LIGERLPELKEHPETLPTKMRIFKHSKGAILGEEDISEDMAQPLPEEG